MPYYNTDNYPTLRDAIKEQIDLRACAGRTIDSYHEFNATDKAAIIGALIRDTPVEDMGDIFYDAENKFNLLNNLSSFIEGKNYAKELQLSFIKSIEATYKDFLIGFTEQVLSEIASDAREYAAAFHNRLSDRVEREMGMH